MRAFRAQFPEQVTYRSCSRMLHIKGLGVPEPPPITTAKRLATTANSGPRLLELSPSRQAIYLPLFYGHHNSMRSHFQGLNHTQGDPCLVSLPEAFLFHGSLVAEEREGVPTFCFPELNIWGQLDSTCVILGVSGAVFPEGMSSNRTKQLTFLLSTGPIFSIKLFSTNWCLKRKHHSTLFHLLSLSHPNLQHETSTTPPRTRRGTLPFETDSHVPKKTALTMLTKIQHFESQIDWILRV